jgi:hypothetical protein
MTDAPRRRIPRPPGELPTKLREQFGFLQVSAQAFDAGFEAEAVRLAGICRVLFMPAGGQSLMYQLGKHDAITLPDTADFEFHERRGLPPLGSPLAPGGLTVIGHRGPQPCFRAPLDSRMDTAEWVPLKTWESRVAVRSSAGVTHSRADFIEVLANQEGGMHIDPTFDEAYGTLREDTMGFQFPEFRSSWASER